ncbi:MAG: hypothetical protein PHR55_03360 [Bacilli bacterium]|nr:hypothetical protein [Bacilli bacterium]
MKPTTRLTFLAFYINSLLDQGIDLDYNKTLFHIDNGTILEWLKDEFEDKLDLSLYEYEDKKIIVELFQELYNVVNARKKFLVENNGLSLLLAYCIEGIQRLHCK